MRTAAVVLFLCSALHAASSDANEFFEMRVRPLFANQCYGCHTSTHMGGLQLDTREHLLKGGNSGPAVVPGDPEHSLLIQAVQHTHERIKMPPGKKLDDAEIAVLTSWIKAGAEWGASLPVKAPEYTITPEQRAFWSFQPVRRPSLPRLSGNAKGWLQSPIDSFILAKLESKGLQPAPAADKRTLIRRATYDLTGLPPTPEEVDAFAADRSPDAFAKVVDRLLASPRYGERWGRFWLDVARYSDDKLASEREEPYPNAYRYRDWVIAAFNDDMPYDEFIKAQIAADLIPTKDRARIEPALGFYALSPEFQDDRVDVTTRGFLALTVACAQCHDHKFDPIPTKDYYSLHGVFTSTELSEYPLASEEVVKAWQAQSKKIEEQKKVIDEFIKAQSAQLADVLAAQTADYVRSAAGQKVTTPLDKETLERWKKYLDSKNKDHHYLDDWRAQDPEKIQVLVLQVSAENKEIEDKNHIILGAAPNRNDLSQANLLSFARDKYVFWRSIFGDGGVLHYSGEKIDRFLSPIFKQYVDGQRADLHRLEKALPPQYPFLQVIRDNANPADDHVQIRGSADNLGEVAPRRFLQVLAKGDPPRFTKGSGRMELAEAIANRDNPLTARVIVNRVWQHHFGQGIVRTPSNFGRLGDRPSHPELLDFLASEFIDNGWSIKKLHRAIMLSSVYQLSGAYMAKNAAEDPENRLLWRSNRRRLDVESMRDSILAVAGDLDLTAGGPPAKLAPVFLRADNRRRTVYGFVSRRRLDGTLALFDFPNPNSTSEKRIDTNVPVQRLFFMNSGFVQQQAKRFAARLKSADGEARIDEAYRLALNRKPTAAERKLGLAFVKSGEDPWTRFAQVLLSSNEFNFVE